MTTDDQELASLRRAFATGSPQQTDPSTCLAPETIWDAVRGALPADEVRKAVQHIAACASCAEEWRLARALQQQEQEAAAPVPAPLRFAPRRRLLRSWGLAAAAALALSVVGVQWFQRTQQPEYRGQKAAVHSQVAEGKALPRDHFLLKWSIPAVAGATYGVKVSTEDLRAVASAEGLKAPEYQVPASALTGLPAGSKLLWNVEADLPEGGHLTSPTFVTAVQ